MKIEDLPPRFSYNPKYPPQKSLKMTVHLWSCRQRNVFYFLLERHGSNPDGRRMSLGDRRERPQEQVHRRRLAGQRLEIQGT